VFGQANQHHNTRPTKVLTAREALQTAGFQLLPESVGGRCRYWNKNNRKTMYSRTEHCMVHRTVADRKTGVGHTA